MRGEWQPAYMTLLHELKRQTNRELDRAQVGGPIPQGDPFAAAVTAVMVARG